MPARFATAIVSLGLLLCGSGLVLAQPVADEAGQILVDYQKKEAFCDRARLAVLHLQAEGPVAPGFDPDFRPRLSGAATLVRLPDGSELVLTSALLVKDAVRIVVARRHGQHTGARVLRTVLDDTVAVLGLEDRKALGELAPLALDEREEALAVGRTVFSLDNLASGLEVLTWGVVAAPGEPPLEHLRLVSLEYSAGHPLLGPEARLAGLCFRPHTPTDRRCFAVRGVDLRAALAPDPAKRTE